MPACATTACQSEYYLAYIEPWIPARRRQFNLQQYLSKLACATAEFNNGLRCGEGGMCAHCRDGYIFVPALRVLSRADLIVTSARLLMAQHAVHWGHALRLGGVRYE